MGVLDSALFRTRADNLAQDINDRFILRTTDTTPMVPAQARPG